MRNDDFTIYPEGLRLLKDSGIEARVETLRGSEEGLSFIFNDHVREDELTNVVADLKDRGYYDRMPETFTPHFKKTMNGLFKKPEDCHWTIRKPKEKMVEPCVLEDLLLFTGEFPAMILKPGELWDYEAFGFANPSAFVGVVSAYIIKKSKDAFSQDGYTWTTKRQDGSEVVNQITGDMNADLRIFQTDIAPYETEDPLGNKTLFRPRSSKDSSFVAAYHSTEPTLLVAVLKYIEQMHITVPSLSNCAREIIQFGESLGQGGGTCAEHFGGSDLNPGIIFLPYGRSIPVLDEHRQTVSHSPYGLAAMNGEGYGIYISHDGELLISHQTPRDVKEPFAVNARFATEDAEHLLKGLIYQSARGLGRTSARQLLRLISYRFSPSFQTRL